MKRLSKILMLVLVVALTLGCVFVIAASAADLPAGVSSSTNDLQTATDTSLGWRWPSIKDGVASIGVSANGNKYWDYTDYDGINTAGKNHDTALTGYTPDINQPYYIYELDIATKTALPNGFGLSYQYSAYTADWTAQSGAKSGWTEDFFTVVNGKLNIGGKEVPAVEGSDWNHITIVIDWVQENKVYEYTDGEGNPATKEYVYYDNTVVNVYADGVLMRSFKPFEGKKLCGFYRAFLGWSYNDGGRTGNAPGNSIAIDNYTTTTVATTYPNSGDAYLAQLFNGEVASLQQYAGNEVKYNANGYTYPENLNSAYVTRTLNGNTTTVGGYKTLAAAIEAACDLKSQNAKATYDVYLLNNEGYMSGETYVGFGAGVVTRALTLHTNGKLFTAPTVAGIAKEPVITGENEETVYTYGESKDYVTFYYYTEGTIQEAIDGDTDPEKVADVVAGVAPIAPEVDSVYDAATGLFTVFNGWDYYVIDEDTEEPVAFTLGEITEDMYGMEIFAIAKIATATPLFEIDGKYYVDAADLVNGTGKTIKLLANVTTSATLANTVIDLNGKALTVNGTLFSGKGSAVVNSAATAGTVYVNGCMNATKSANYTVGLTADGTKINNGRITLVTNAKNALSGNMYVDMRWYKVDMVNTFSCGRRAGLLNINCNDGNGNYYYEDCNFYAVKQVFFAFGNEVNGHNFYFTNCNFYGESFYFTEAWDKPVKELGSFNFTNCGLYYKGGYNTYSGGRFNYYFDENCTINANPANADLGAHVPEGYRFVALETPTTEQVTFSYYASADATEATVLTMNAYTSYVVEIVPASATYEFYNGETSLGSQVVYLGDVAEAPVIASIYENGILKYISGWVVYDGETVVEGGLTAVTDEMNGKTYKVVAVWGEIEVAFVIVNGDSVEYKAAYELTNANVTGKTIKLMANVTVAETLSNVKIDLNGYNLTNNAQLTGGGSYIYNSAATASTIYANAALCGGGNYNTIHLGYSDDNTKVDGDITVVASVSSIGNDAYGNNVYYYNVDFVATVACDGTRQHFIGRPSGSGEFYVEKCSFFFLEAANLIYSYNVGAAKLTLVDCELYFTKGGRFIAFNEPRGTTHGQVTVTLENTQVYGAFNAPHMYPEKYDYVFDENTVLGAIPYVEGHVTLPEGYIVLEKVTSKNPNFTYTNANGEQVTINETYTANYAVVVEPAKVVVNVYDKAYGDNGKATEMNAYVGYVPSFPAIGSYGDNVSVSAPTGNYVLYNANGEIVGTIAVGAAFTQELVDAGVVAAYPEVTKKATAFVIIGDSWDFKSADEFTAAVVNGKTIQLIADVVVTETLSGVKIDLNGCKLTVKVQLSDTGCYIYNTNTETAGTMYVGATLYGGANYYNIKIGYSADGVKAEGRITFVAEVNNVGSTSYGAYANYYNVDFVSELGGGWSSTLFGQLSGSAHLTAENCDFYFLTGNYIAHCANNNGTVNLSLTNCNVYFAKGGAFMGKNYNANPANINLVNTHVYGAVGQSTTSESYIYNIDALSTFGGTPFANGNAGDGNVLVPIAGATAETITFDYSVPAEDGNGYDAKTFSATLWSSAKIGTYAELSALYATFYRNVNLDVNINFNLYVPVTVGVMNADVVKIGGVDYYVVTYTKAAKDAYTDNWVSVNINGVNYAYNASLVNYVTALNNVQSTDDYVVDSKKLAQYVVYYVKTAAMNAYADAETPIDTTKIDELLKGFELTAEDKAVVGAIENVASITGVNAATLDLNSSVGIVFKVTEGYNGKLTVTFNGETDEYDYTTTAAGAEEYIVISGIEVYNFTNDVVITNDAGETMTYNLATYVANKTTEIGYATYAYAVQAKAYNDVYGAAKVVD